MPKVVLTDPIPPPLAERLQALMPRGVDFAVVASPSDADLAVQAADADVLLVIHRWVDARVLALAPRVRFVQRAGVGYDNLDVAALKAAGVVVASTPGANTIGVAEHTILLMLVLLKRFHEAEAATRSGRWNTNELVQAGIGDLAGTTVGLVGFGQIGRAVAPRLQAFGANVIYWSRSRADSATEARFGTAYRPLDELLGTGSIVSLHLPLTEATRGMIGTQQFAQMRRGALLINTARGGLVDEAALLAALEHGQLGGAGLDVLENERDGHHPFAHLPNVIVTPHIAGASQASTMRIMQMAVANVGRFFRGEPPIDRVPGT